MIDGKLQRSLGSIIGVRTSGMCTVVRRTLSSSTRPPITRVKASSAAFEATYAEKPGALVCTPIELIS